MQRLLGKVILQQTACVLKYYLSGSRRSGYSVVIVQEKQNQIFYSKCENLTNSIEGAKRFCYKLIRGVVFPEQLQEIVEDHM